MADPTHENAYVIDILGSLELYAGESKKDKNKRMNEAFKKRTTDMAVIIEQQEMGKVCVQYNNVQDWHNRKEKSCKNAKGCLMCKAFADTHESLKLPINNETTVGMTEWINNMR
eukprot:295047-Heterocapsa_arctica.AAC.1